MLRKEKNIIGRNVLMTILTSKLYFIGFRYFEQHLDTLEMRRINAY